jgi:hypothetical protein
VPLLEWDCSVAASAQEWADRGVFEHSKSYDIPPPAGPAGENLALGHDTATAAIDGWYGEVKDWSFEAGQATGGGETGHFTAMVWKGAKKLGCGEFSSTKLRVCRYKAGDTKTGDTPNMQGARPACAETSIALS